MKTARITLAFVILSLFTSASSTFGQATNAQLTGQINDNTGAAVAGAHVTVTNTDTNLLQTAESNGQGV